MRNGTDLAPNAGGTEPAPDTGFDQVLWSPIGVCAVIVPVLWWALGTADEASLAGIPSWAALLLHFGGREAVVGVFLVAGWVGGTVAGGAVAVALGRWCDLSLAVGLLAFGAWVASAPRSATVHPGGPPIPRKADP